MSIRNFGAIAALLFGAIAAPSWASEPAEGSKPQYKTIDVGGHPVPVIAGGLYDRYRSNTPLSVIQTEAPGVDLSWFKTLKREKVDMGFESWSPNFFYKNSRVTAVFTADLDRLRELMPAEVLKEVQPLQVWPGRGLVALTAYSYHYCDNDAYNEVALSIVTNQPGKANWGPLSLVGQVLSKDFSGYVLKLPVNTELARVRGVVGYNLPKWLTGIRFQDRGDTLAIEITDSSTGKLDVSLQARKLGGLSDKPTLTTNRFTNLDHKGQLATGHATSRQLSSASSMSSDSVSINLEGGTLSQYIQLLKLGRMLRYEYVPDFQLALYASRPLGAAERGN